MGSDDPDIPAWPRRRSARAKSPGPRGRDSRLGGQRVDDDAIVISTKPRWWLTSRAVEHPC